MTEARQELTALPGRLSGCHDAISVTRRGRPVLAILPWEEYEALVETLEVLADPELTAALRQGIREAKASKGIPWERAKRTLGL